jgi:hypothetical protein
MQPFRLSLVGALKGPHLFDMLKSLEKKKPFREFRKIANFVNITNIV